MQPIQMPYIGIVPLTADDCQEKTSFFLENSQKTASHLDITQAIKGC